MYTTSENPVNQDLRDHQISLYGIFTLTTVAAFISGLIAWFGLVVIWLFSWSAGVGTVIGVAVAAVTVVAHLATQPDGNYRPHYARLRNLALRIVLAGVIGGIVVELSTYVILALLLRQNVGTPTWSFWVHVSNGSSSSPSPAMTAVVLLPALFGALTNSMASSFRGRNLSAIGFIARVAGASSLTVSAPFFVLFIKVGILLYQNKTHGLMPIAALLYLGIAALIGAISGAICAAMRVVLDALAGTAANDRNARTVVP